MAKYKSIVITKAGLALVAAAHSGDTIEFASIKTGNGIYDGTEVLEDMTDLKSVQQSFGITGITREDTVAKVRSVLTNEGVTEGYYHTEIGLYATDSSTNTEVLYAVVVAEDGMADYFPPYKEFPQSITLEVYVTVSGIEEGVEFTASILADTYVTVQDFEDYKTSMDESIESQKKAIDLVASNTKDYTDKEIALHTDNKENPHNVTAEQLDVVERDADYENENLIIPLLGTSGSLFCDSTIYRLNGITATLQEDGTVLLSGTATENVQVNFISNYGPGYHPWSSAIPDKELSISGLPIEPSGSTIRLVLKVGSASSITGAINNNGTWYVTDKEAIVTPSAGTYIIIYNFSLYISNGYTCPNNLVIKPMIISTSSKYYKHDENGYPIYVEPKSAGINRTGRFCIASELPAYQNLSRYQYDTMPYIPTLQQVSVGLNRLFINVVSRYMKTLFTSGTSVSASIGNGFYMIIADVAHPQGTPSAAISVVSKHPNNNYSEKTDIKTSSCVKISRSGTTVTITKSETDAYLSVSILEL